jgi:hypothetical protein
MYASEEAGAFALVGLVEAREKTGRRNYSVVINNTTTVE